MSFKRSIFNDIRERIRAPRQFIQVLAGPRQVGKTTLVSQLLDEIDIPHRYASADGAEGTLWIEQQWQAARMLLSEPGTVEAVLVLDEIQKIPGWTETVKRFWDEDTRERRPLKPVLLGSSPLLIRKGLTESLAGRFELVRFPHWTFSEMRDCFGFDLDRYLFFGGYPGAAGLTGDETRWRRYLLDSLVETTITKDVLMLERIDKPALLRALFLTGAAYSGRILSYTKLLGQLQDAGNTTTLAHYLALLDGAGMLAGLQKHAAQEVRRRGSSPKFQVYNNALFTAMRADTFDEARRDPERWGRIAESAVGAFLLNEATVRGLGLHYWRETNAEVDFLLTKGDRMAAIEVKSGATRERPAGLDAFTTAGKHIRRYLVGTGGIAIEEFLTLDIDQLF